MASRNEDVDDDFETPITALSEGLRRNMQISDIAEQAYLTGTSIDELIEQTKKDISAMVERDPSFTTSLRDETQSLEEATRGKTPHQVLQICLSKRSHLTTHSSFAERHQALRVPGKWPLNVIGVGTFGVVFEVPGTVWVIKKIKDCDRKGGNLTPLRDTLLNDWRNGKALKWLTWHFDAYMHTKGVFLHLNHPRIPVYGDVFCVDNESAPELNPWWVRNGSKFRGTEVANQQLPGPLFLFERILPIPKLLRDGLIEHYFPPDQQKSALESPENKSCIIRPYLGMRFEDLSPEQIRHHPSNDGWTLRNFPLYLDQLRDFEQLKPEKLAQEMALAVANAHWALHLDLMDSEFVLGSSAKDDLEPEMQRLASEYEKKSHKKLDIPRLNIAPGDMERLLPTLPGDDMFLPNEWRVPRSNIAPPASDIVLDALSSLATLGEEKESLFSSGKYPDFHRRSVQMWLVDFDKAHHFEIEEKSQDKDIKNLVNATCANDPYYPSCTPSRLEDWKLWLLFRSTYIAASKILLAKAHVRNMGGGYTKSEKMKTKEFRLPHEVMNQWLARGLNNMSKAERKAWKQRTKDEAWPMPGDSEAAV